MTGYREWTVVRSFLACGSVGVEIREIKEY